MDLRLFLTETNQYYSLYLQENSLAILLHVQQSKKKDRQLVVQSFSHQLLLFLYETGLLSQSISIPKRNQFLKNQFFISFFHELKSQKLNLHFSS